MTAQETAKSLAPITDGVRRTTSFRVSADLKCRLLVTEETSTRGPCPRLEQVPDRAIIVTNFNVSSVV